MGRIPNPRRHLPVVAALVLNLIPSTVFYVLLARQTSDIPIVDDYGALLNFLNLFLTAPSLAAKASLFFTLQHGEYRLIFDHLAALVDYQLTGHLSFAVLSWVGNVFVMLLGVLLFTFFLPGEPRLERRLLLFLPISFLLFQLQYQQTLNWAMGSLQNFPVLFFAFAAIALLHRKRLIPAVLCMFASIAASANGLLLIPLGLIILIVQRRKLPGVSGWLAASALAVFTYFYRYQAISHVHPHSLVTNLFVRMPAFLLCFVGSAAARPVPATIVGMLILTAFAYAFLRRFRSESPIPADCALFLLFSALLTMYGRSDLGVLGSLSSRYTLYSALLLIFVWFAAVQRVKRPLQSSRLYVAALASTILFATAADITGYHALRDRQDNLRLGMYLYQHPTSAGNPPGPVIPEPGLEPFFDALNRSATGILGRSAQLGTYVPPKLASPR
jgi:hypothetical protein